MSLQSVREALEDFLTSAEPQVIALSGVWGSGKTYFWRDFVAARSASVADNRTYSYVSLFGIESLPALKEAIFENGVSLSDATSEAATTRKGWRAQLKIPTFRKGKQDALRLSRRVARVVELLPYLKDAGPLARGMLFGIISEYVVCIDDLERHSESLRLKDTLGLLTMLKEQKRCRCIVILNMDSLSDEDRTTFDTLREKVFDREFVFQPTPAECSAIAFSRDSNRHQSAADYATRLNVANIRVLFRIRRLIDSLAALTNGLAEEIANQVMQSAVLLGWCYNTKNTGVPAYYYVRELSYANFIDIGTKKEKPAEEQEWNALLDQYGYHATDDVDLAICHTLERGYPEPEEWTTVLEDKSRAVQRGRLEAAFTDAWAIFHNRFDEDEEELATGLETAMRAGAEYVIPMNASATVTLLRQLGRGQRADELMEYWIRVQQQANPRVLDLENSPFTTDIEDPRFREAVEKAFQEVAKDDRSLYEVASKIARSSGWSEADVKRLASGSVNDYYEMFRGLHEDGAKAIVRACLRFKSIGGDELHTVIGERAYAALQQLARGSRLNALRVRSLGVLPAHESPTE